VESAALPGDAEVLAGESAANNVNGFEVVLADFPHVPVSADFGPVLFEDFGCIIIVLHLPDRRDASALESEVDTADTRE